MKRCGDCGKIVLREIEFEDDDTILCKKCYFNIKNENKKTDIEISQMEKESYNF